MKDFQDMVRECTALSSSSGTLEKWNAQLLMPQKKKKASISQRRVRLVGAVVVEN